MLACLVIVPFSKFEDKFPGRVMQKGGTPGGDHDKTDSFQVVNFK